MIEVFTSELCDLSNHTKAFRELIQVTSTDELQFQVRAERSLLTPAQLSIIQFELLRRQWRKDQLSTTMFAGVGSMPMNVAANPTLLTAIDLEAVPPLYEKLILPEYAGSSSDTIGKLMNASVGQVVLPGKYMAGDTLNVMSAGFSSAVGIEKPDFLLKRGARPSHHTLNVMSAGFSSAVGIEKPDFLLKCGARPSHHDIFWDERQLDISHAIQSIVQDTQAVSRLQRPPSVDYGPNILCTDIESTYTSHSSPDILSGAEEWLKCIQGMQSLISKKQTKFITDEESSFTANWTSAALGNSLQPTFIRRPFEFPLIDEMHAEILHSITPSVKSMYYVPLKKDRQTTSGEFTFTQPKKRPENVKQPVAFDLEIANLFQSYSSTQDICGTKEDESDNRVAETLKILGLSDDKQ